MGISDLSVQDDLILDTFHQLLDICKQDLCADALLREIFEEHHSREWLDDAEAVQSVEEKVRNLRRDCSRASDKIKAITGVLRRWIFSPTSALWERSYVERGFLSYTFIL